MVGMASIGEAVSRVGAPDGATPRLIAVMVETADGLHAVHRIPEPDGKMPEVIMIRTFRAERAYRFCGFFGVYCKYREVT